jgi:hypothetical protein
MATDNVGECLGTKQGVAFCNLNAPPSAEAKTASTAPAAPKPAAKFVCPAGNPGITSIKASAGQRVRLYTQSECNGGLKGRWTGNGKKTWGMANDKVGECLGAPNGGNFGYCNRNKPASTAAKNILASTTAAKHAAKPLPTPVSYSGSGTGASLTCNTFPVFYGNGQENMVSGFPHTNSRSPPVWNVVQPPSGWNSKYGFMSS